MLTTAFIAIMAMLIRLLSGYKSPVNFDTYGHLYYASEIKEQKVGPFSGIKTNAYGSAKHYHPFLWHWLVSQLPIDIVLKKQKYISFFTDALIASGIFYFLQYTSNEISKALLGCLLYLFSPIFFSSLSTGPRVNSLTPRLFSEGLGFLLTILLIISNSIPYTIWFSLVVLASMFLLISQKFGTQVVWFIFPIFSLLSGDLTLLYILVLASLLAIIISRGSYLNIFGRHVLHSLNHFNLNRAGKLPLSDRNSLKWLLHWKALSTKQIFRELVVRNSFSAISLKYPLVLLFIFLICTDLGSNGLRSFNTAELLTLSALIVSLITSTRFFIFLGEAERYLVYVAPATIVSVLKLADENGYMPLVYLVIALGIIFWVSEITLNFFRKPSTHEIASKKVVSFLNNSSLEGGVLSVPYHAVGVYRIMLETGRNIIFPTFMEDSKVLSFTKAFEERYPFIDVNKIDKICEQYPIKYVIVDTEKVLFYGNLESASWRRLPHDFAPFLVFERID